ncbi:MAG: adenylosuccinate lyase [Candidatus Methanofastidiosia archaeon]
MIHPIENRYGSEEMREVFERETKLNYLLDVELALLRAHAELGEIPKRAFEELSFNRKKVTISRVDEIEAEIRHDLMAVVKALSETSEFGGYVHLGATSNDIIDTAQALQMKRAMRIIFKDLEELKEILKGLALEHKKTICIGRTHGQHAIPTTYGMKFALFYSELERDLERLKVTDKRICGKMSGAVGTFASLSPKVQKLVGEYLQIQMADISNQIVPRDLHAELCCNFAILASTLDKISTEIRNLARTEIFEVSESFGKKQVGSSTMPHKKNPEICEKISGLSRIIYSNTIPALLNNVSWHERDLTNSAPERVLIPENFLLMDEMLKCMKRVLKNLIFHHENIRKNLMMEKRVMAESVMLEMVRKGASRQEAHEILRKLALKKGDFERLLRESKEVRRFLNEREIKSALKPESYLGSAIETVERVIGRDV